MKLDQKQIARETAETVLKKAKKREAGKIPVKIDRLTTIFINPGEDPEEAKTKYKNRVK